MRKTVYDLLREAQQRMSGYATYMNYQFIHFSVLAEPAALLSVSVEINGDRYDLENTADVAIPEDNQFALIPKKQAYLFPICKAVGQVHPDYKIEQKPLNEEEETDTQGEGNSQEEAGKYILCTMPEVTKSRRDAGMEYVKTVFDETTSKLDAMNISYGLKISKQLSDAKPEEVDAAKGELQELHDKHIDLCKAYREEKEQQIEKAYQEYLKAREEKESAQQEKQAAQGENAGKQFNINTFTEGME